MPVFENLKNEDVKHLLNCYKKAIDVNIITSITDSKGLIIYANERFCEISQFSKQELIGQSHSIINSGYHPGEFFTDLWKTITTGNTWKGEIKNKAKDNSFYWVETVILPVETRQEKQYLSLRALINERKALEKQKEDYIRSLEEMMVYVSHKTRRPIASMLGLLQLEVDEISKNDFKKIVAYLKTSIEDLDVFTKEFTVYLDNLKNNIKNKRL